MGSTTGRCLLATIACALLLPASAWGWSSPIDLSPRTDFDQAPAAALDPGGDAVVAWQNQVDSYHSVIEATVRRAGGTWGSDQTLSVPADWQNANPSVAVDDKGDALAVWGATNGNSLGETRAALAPAGQPFQSPTQISDTYNGSTGDAYPFAAFDGAGNAIAFWEQNDNRVYYAARPAGGAFSSPQQVPHAASDQGASWPSYALARNGEAVAVWDGSDAGYAVIRNSNGTFDAPQPLVSGVQSGPIHVAMDDAGDAIAVWAEQINNQGYMKAAVRAAGSSSFGAPVTLAQVYYTGTNEANVAMDPAGDATIVWAGDTASPFLYTGASAVVHRAGGSGFGAPQALGFPSAQDPPSVAYDRAGDTYVIWRTYDSNTSSSITGRVLAEIAPAGGSFSGQPETISERDYNVWPPALAAGQSSALAVWPLGVFNGNASQFWIQEADSAGSAVGTPGTTPSAPGNSPTTTTGAPSVSTSSSTAPTRSGTAVHQACREPALVGLRLSQAEHRLRAAHCGVKITRRPSRRRRGRVIRASGRRGNAYPSGHRITLTVGE